MFKEALRNLLSGDLNAIGLLLGFVGTVIVFFFGLPSVGVLSGGSYVEIQITPTMTIYSWCSRVGLLLIAVGFALQFLAAPRTKN